MNLISNFNNKTRRGVVIGLACGAFALLAGCSANSNGASSNGGKVGTAPDVSSFMASPTSVATGGSTQLTWNVTGATSCVGTGGDSADNDGWSGTTGVTGPFTTPPLSTAGSYVYTLTCTAADGSTAAKSVTVIVGATTNHTPPTVTFSATPTTVATGSSTVLSWSSTGAATCLASGGDKTDNDGWDGTTGTSNSGFTTGPLTTPGVYNYVLTCTASNGSNSVNQLSVMVGAANGSGKGATIPFAANPSSIPFNTGGGSTTVNLTWNQPDASSCALTDPAGNPITVPSPSYSGNVPVTVVTSTAGTSTYTLSCTNAATGAAETPQTATVTVQPQAGAITGGGPNSPTIVNTGITPTTITQGGTPLTGNFICTLGAQATLGAATTAVGANGLIGGQLTSLLNGLGGSTVTTLLNSVTQPNNVIDDNLDTYATYSLTAGGLSTLDSVDLDVLAAPGVTAPVGSYAVFGITLPSAALNLSSGKSIIVSTYLDSPTAAATTPQESVTMPLTQLQLLGSGGNTSAFLGLKTTKPYNRAVLELQPGLISAVVGPSLYADEFCTGGTLK